MKITAIVLCCPHPRDTDSNANSLYKFQLNLPPTALLHLLKFLSETGHLYFWKHTLLAGHRGEQPAVDAAGACAPKLATQRQGKEGKEKRADNTTGASRKRTSQRNVTEQGMDEIATPRNARHQLAVERDDLCPAMRRMAAIAKANGQRAG